MISLQLCVLMCFIGTTGPDEDAATAIAIARAQEQAKIKKANCGCMLGDACKCTPGKCDCQVTLSYAEATTLAVSKNKPLVVFLDGPKYVQNFATHVPGSMSCSVETLPGFTGPLVIISVPRNGVLYYHKSLPAWTTAADIAKEVGRITTVPFRPVLAFQQTFDNCGPGG